MTTTSQPTTSQGIESEFLFIGIYTPRNEHQRQPEHSVCDGLFSFVEERIEKQTRKHLLEATIIHLFFYYLVLFLVGTLAYST